MKTRFNIRNTAAFITASVVLTLTCEAQNFSRSHNYVTGDSQFGMSALLSATGIETYSTSSNGLPIPANYSLHASGRVTGVVLGTAVNAMTTTGTVKLPQNGIATFTGNISSLGVSIFNVFNKTVPCASPHFIRTWSASKLVPLTVFGVPVTVTAKVTGSADIRFRVNTTATPGIGLGAKLDVKMGPVADLAAYAEAGTVTGAGLSNLNAGASGSLRLGTAGITSNAVITPNVLQVLTNSPFPELPDWVTGADTQIRTVLYGAPVTNSVTANTADTSGRLDIFAQGTRLFITSRVTHNLANYTGTAPVTVNLLNPISSALFD